MLKTYQYVGPHEIRQQIPAERLSVCIHTNTDLDAWLQQQRSNSIHARIAATFIIDEQQHLWLADRQSEHIACSGDEPVLSAGEVFFELISSHWEVTEITNQSTGFCPEPESFSVVNETLNRIGIPHPTAFTTELIFRRCEHCNQICVVKDDWYYCEVCNQSLNRLWNF